MVARRVWAPSGYGVVCAKRALDVMPLLLFLLAMGTLYSLIFSNIGLGYRYRATLMPWLLIFAMVGSSDAGSDAWPWAKAFPSRNPAPRGSWSATSPLESSSHHRPPERRRPGPARRVA